VEGHTIAKEHDVTSKKTYFLAIKPPNDRTIHGVVVMDSLLVTDVYCVS